MTIYHVTVYHVTLHVIIIIILFIPTWKIEPTSSISSRPSARHTSISPSTLTSSSLAPPHAKGGQENNLTGIISGVMVVVINSTTDNHFNNECVDTQEEKERNYEIIKYILIVLDTVILCIRVIH